MSPLRRAVLACAVVAASAVSAAPASAYRSCVATATPPHLEVGRDGVHATGYFTCAQPASDLYLEVCIEELDGLSLGWRSLGCSATVLNDGGAYLAHEVTVGVPIYSTVLRATATGQNDRGETATGSSAPVPWVNCACFIG